MPSVKGVCVVDFEAGKGRIKHSPTRHDDDVQAGRDLMMPKDLPCQPFCAISLDRGPELPTRRHTEPGSGPSIGNDEQRQESSSDPNTSCVCPLEIRPSPNPLFRPQPEHAHSYCSSETVKRLRPLLRRLLRTIRPFLVAIRTLNPCVFFRRLVFG
jgi:hypothetical protein